MNVKGRGILIGLPLAAVGMATKEWPGPGRRLSGTYWPSEPTAGGRVPLSASMRFQGLSLGSFASENRWTVKKMCHGLYEFNCRLGL